MAANSPQEQLMLELINRARMDPLAEAARQNIDLNKGLQPGTISSAPKQVLAMNDLLVVAADRHSNWMLHNDLFGHDEPASLPAGRTGLQPGDRMKAAGYLFSGSWASGENISWSGTFPGSIDLTKAIIGQHNSLFHSAGHRTNIMNASFREIGIGQLRGTFTQGGTGYDASMVTQNFALSGSKVFVTGVVYNDTIADDFFSVGEQTVGRAVTGTGGASDATGAGGGYELGFTSAGAKTVSFNLAGGTISLALTIASANIKLDVVSGNQIWTDTSVRATSANVAEIHALGLGGITLVGAAGNERIYGNAAANALDGGAGNDLLHGAAGNDTLTGGIGNDTLNGSLGGDTMRGGAGNDIYVVDHANDMVNESLAGSAGTDTVQSFISFSLGNTARVTGSVEYLTLLGSAAINGTGNSLNNAITGNTAGNALSGGAGNDMLGGGLGKDTLAGGAGYDTFLFNTALNQTTNVDVISDYFPAQDTIRLENAIFTALTTAGTLAAAAFSANAAGAARDRSDRIIYDTDNGWLIYDHNGSATGGAVQFARLPPNLAVTHADFVVV